MPCNNYKLLQYNTMPTVLIYLLIFLLVGIAFVFVNLTLGSLLRPRVRNVEKDIPYECGVNPIGNATRARITRHISALPMLTTMARFSRRPLCS